MADSITPSRSQPQQPSDLHHHGVTRVLPDIEAMIEAAQLPAKATAWSLAIFRQLAEAEAAVHGIPPQQVHFHEVGATDAIVDIVGTCLGLDYLDIEHIYCSPLPTGGGTVWAAHGRLPVPAPAVLNLLQMAQVPIYSNGIQRELVTPTGAAIATTLAKEFGPPPSMTISKIGLGAGNHNLQLPNILRLWIGEGEREPENVTHSSPTADYPPNTPHQSPFKTQTITVLETQFDDLNSQVIGHLFDQLFAVGALDVFTQAVGMKKSRPGILLTVICLPHQVEVCEQVIYRETTTLGIRRRQQARSLLHREFQTVATPYGEIPIKVASIQPGSAVLNAKPEYEDCLRLAQQHQVPWLQVYQAALQVWQEQQR